MTNELASAARPLVVPFGMPPGRRALAWRGVVAFYRQNCAKLSVNLYFNHLPHHRILTAQAVRAPRGMVAGFSLIGVG
jgi:hypothetical protein